MPADYFKDKCVRIRMKRGEVLDETFDALMIKVEYIDEDAEEQVEVTMEGFDLGKLFEESMAGVSDEVKAKVTERWQRTFTSQD